ncbi:MAG: hypothetical protein ACRC35_12440 [Angustibacter sp.]
MATASVAATALVGAAGANAGSTGGSGGATAASNASAAASTSRMSVAAQRRDQRLARYRTPDGRPMLTRAAQGTDPRLSFEPPGVVLDRAGWQVAAGALAKQRAASVAQRQARSRAATAAPLSVTEQEQPGTRGGNDSYRTAQAIPGFGTARGANPRAAITGDQAPEPVPASAVTTLKPGAEPNENPDTASDLGSLKTGRTYRVNGVISAKPVTQDNPKGQDIDWYRFGLRAGQQVTITVKRTSGDLQPYPYLYDSAGLEDNVPPWQGVADLDTGEAVLKAIVPTTGTYTLDLQDGLFENVAKRGRYSVEITTQRADRDAYAVQLRAGDVLGATTKDDDVTTPELIIVRGPDGQVVNSSAGDASGVYPADSPLPGTAGRGPVTDHVARTSGTYYVERMGGSGRYSMSVEAYRYGGAAQRQTQTIFLDTDGARVNGQMYVPWGSVADLTPLSAFLGKWGLTAAQEPALIEAIKRNLQENLDRDLRESGLSDTVSVKVVTSLDGPDPWGKPGVTRLVLGGTIDETNLPTIGVAESIDPGNFDREETGVVLMDVLSATGADADAASLNTYLKPGSDRLRFVGQAIGNVASHEVGHMIGNWHTDNANDVVNLMDAGGEGYDHLYGVGPDGVGGTADDTDTDFGQDVFMPVEGSTGIEDTLARSTWGMSTR